MYVDLRFAPVFVVPWVVLYVAFMVLIERLVPRSQHRLLLVTLVTLASWPLTWVGGSAAVVVVQMLPLCLTPAAPHNVEFLAAIERVAEPSWILIGLASGYGLGAAIESTRRFVAKQFGAPDLPT